MSNDGAERAHRAEKLAAEASARAAEAQAQAALPQEQLQAQEESASAHPWWRWMLKWRCYVVIPLVVLVLIAAFVGSVMVAAPKPDPVELLTPTVTPSAAPITSADAAILRAKNMVAEANLINLSKQALRYPPPADDDATAEEQALQWLIEEDDSDLDISSFAAGEDDFKFRQLFMLMSLAFHFGRPPLSVDLNGDLTGTLPTEFGLLTAVRTMIMPAAELTGTIPTELGLLTSLSRLELDRNSLTGTIHTELRSMIEAVATYFQAYFHSNKLTGPMPFCGFINSVGKLTAICGEDTVVCPCCTVCYPNDDDDGLRGCQSPWFSD